jgi:hypothetical protein
MRFELTLAAAAAATLTVVGAAPAAADLHHDIAEIKRATAKFHNVQKALAAGYLPAEHCIAVPGVGAMGYHYVNPDLVDGVVDPLRPEVLVYQPSGEGRHLKLVAVEYFVPAGTVASHPMLGPVPFEGPMPGHEPGMPVHYDLHVWLWQHNPDGTFATWNPAGSCQDVG